LHRGAGTHHHVLMQHSLRGYTQIQENGRTAMVRVRYQAAVAAALLREEGCRPFATSGGRGIVMRFAVEDGSAILRTYRRGGAVRRVLPEGWCWGLRPLQELMVLDHLHRSGLSVPEPLGAAWWRKGLLLHGRIAMRCIEAVDLLEYLSSRPEAADYWLEQTGRTIRAMHDLGVYHADLQVRNVLIAEDKPYLIDFDRARLGEMSDEARARNLLRLRRSFQKHGLESAWFAAVCRGYGIKALPGWLSSAYSVKAQLTDLLSGRGAR